MATEAPQLDIDALVEYCHNRTKDSLRGVYEYSNDDIELHYLRDDIDAKYSTEVIEEIVRKTQEVETSIRDIPYNEPIGEPKASLHTFRDGVLVHLYNWNPVTE